MEIKSPISGIETGFRKFGTIASFGMGGEAELKFWRIQLLLTPSFFLVWGESSMVGMEGAREMLSIRRKTLGH